jgi:hypothetical protein
MEVNIEETKHKFVLRIQNLQKKTVLQVGVVNIFRMIQNLFQGLKNNKTKKSVT